MQYVIIALMILSAVPASAQQQFPAEFRQRGIQECMQQPLQVPIQVTNQQRLVFCTCLFDYYQQSFSYETMVRIDQIARTNPSSIPPDVMKRIEQGTLTCAQQYIFHNR